MLDAMRRGAVNWFAKGLLVLLVVAFAVWGVGDVVRNAGRGTLATIGDATISSDEFRQAYQDEMASYSRRIGRRLTPEQAKMLGVEQRALSRLIGSAAIEAHARDLGLSISDKGVAELIRQEQAFQGPDGKFNQRNFEGYLRQIGMSEPRFVAERRKEEIRDQITDSLLGGVTVPMALIELLHAYREETRVIEMVTPDFAKLVKLAEPDEAKLKAHYEQNKGQFMTPELRKINVLTLSRDVIKARISVSDADVQAFYDADKGKYNVAERRKIQQIPFPDKAAAEKAYAELSKAKDFKDAATKLGFKESDYELGVLAKRDMIDGKVADAAFALKANELSKPVEGQFSIVLVRVTEIAPGKQRPLAEVKAEIVDAIKNERAGEEIRTLHDKVEDAKGAGKLLKEIGTELSIPFTENVETDRAGKTADGKPAIEGAEAQRIAQAAFAASQGIETEAVELSDGGYVWFDLTTVTAAKQKPFEDVKADVTTRVKDEERRREVATIAAKFAERLNAGESMDVIAKEAGAKIEKSNPFNRATSPQGVPQAAVQQAFATAKGRATSALDTSGDARVVLKVVDVTPAPPATPEQVERLKSDLARQMQSDALAQYVSGLQTKLGLKINEAAVRQALGEGGGEAQTE
jgi:peptidyl-prolyl cis-trans isomerase D